MSRKTIWLSVLVLLIPLALQAEMTIPFMVEGTIGDFAPRSRTYEIDGHTYQFPPGTPVENRAGQPLRFDQLKGGAHIRINGEKTYRDDQQEVVHYNKITRLD